MIRSFLASALTALLLSMSATAALAGSLPDRIVFKIGDTPPASTDVAGRIVAKHFSKALAARAGKPIDLAIENVGGSSGVVLLKQAASTEQPDGSVIAFSVVMSRTVSYLANTASLDFDPTKVEVVGAVSRNIPLCVGLRGKEMPAAPDPFRIGYTSKTGAPFLAAKAVASVIGPRVQLIGGFKGLEELPAALERNEVDAYCGLSFDTFRRENRQEELRILYRLSEDTAPGLENIPSLFSELSGDLAQIIPLLLSGNRYFHVAYLPAGAAPEVLELYRAAFGDLAANEAFRTELEAAGITFSFAGGAEVDAFRQKLIDMDRSVWDKAYAFIAPPK